MRETTTKFSIGLFFRNEQGSATVEFAILFPALIFLLAACVWLSLYIVTIGNVQQLTYEVARQALQYRTAAADDPSLCQKIGQELIPELASTMTLIDPDKIDQLTCTPVSGQGWSRVTLVYDASSIGFTPMIRAFNGGSDVIVGRALIMGG